MKGWLRTMLVTSITMEVFLFNRCTEGRFFI